MEARVKDLEKRVARLEGRAAKPSAPDRRRAYPFVRQPRFVPVDMAERFGGAIICSRTDRATKANRDAGYWRELAKRDVFTAGWDWLVRPSRWRLGMRDAIAWCADHGARAYCLNVEPHSEDLRDWRKRDREAVEYAAEARDTCDEHGLELWFTGWALPSKARTFPWRPFCTQADVSIAQPYGVHRPSSLAYTQQSIDEYKAQGARRVIVGRGAHELDRSDGDAWRTSAEIREHRKHTPEGYDEAWWFPAGKPRDALVDAMVD